jgi:alkanesulfonate monooxygenase SsuD/methylene tetrahydromethanopterin reductase-like flavin-dependent oxidoreductase (luciferase family)
MKVGICLSQFSWPIPASELGSRVARIARTADQAGFDSLWTMDHFFQIRVTGEPPESPMPEAYTTLGFIVGQTERIQLGTSVTSVAYRHPGVLLKMITTLDVLSGGRMVLGVGAGAPWNELPAGIDPLDSETVGLGIPMPVARRAVRAPRGAAADRRRDVVGRGEAVRGHALPAGPHAQLAQRAAAAAPAHPRWRRR